MHTKIYRKILKNKMRLLFVPIENVNIVSVGIFVKIGSRYESDNENGIAHFLEHMMFKGTKNINSSDLANKLDNLGAKYNAGTSYENTYYYIYGNNQYTSDYINIISDIYLNPIFKKEDIDIESGVVIEELNMIKDNPQDILHDMLYENIFDNSNLKNPIIGTKKNLKKFSRNDFINFRKRTYIPERTVFIITGNFNLKKISNKTIKIFDKIKSTDDIIELPFKQMKEQNKPKLIIKEKKGLAQTSFSIGFKTEGIYNYNKYIYDLIAIILTSGSSSRLFDLLRNKLGIAYFIDSNHVAYQHEGVLVINAGVNNAKVSDSIKAILEVLGELRENGITEDELNKAKNIVLSNIATDIQTPHDLMVFYGSLELIYNIGDIPPQSIDYTKIINIIDTYKKITLKQINQIINDIFIENNMTICIYGNKPNNKLRM